MDSMLRQLKRALYGWVISDEETYRYCYSKFGGSVNMHPDVINFAGSRKKDKVTYFHTVKNGQIMGAYPLLNDKEIGINAWKRFPLSYDEIMLPLSPACKVALPDHSNRISPQQRDNFFNVNFTVARKNKICIVRDKFSAKNEKNRRNEYNRFLRAGGKCVDQACFTDEEIASFYITLFKARFRETVRCYDARDMTDIIHHLRHMIFGHVLFMNDEPCAIDLIFYAESDHFIYFDVPNGGVDTRFSSLSPGSVLMWKNIHAAREFCEKKNKAMRLSIGAMDERWNYKLRWADAVATGKPFI